MEIVIKKVANGFVVRFEKDEDEYVEETHVFTKYSQVVKFLKERFAE